ncbi:SAM-dependent methyltransferase, partial [Actinoallomurus acaciae]
DAAGPESLADPRRVREVLTGAGLTDVSTAPVDAPQVWGRDAEDAAGFIAGWGPVRPAFDQVDPSVRSRARQALTAALRAFESDGAVRLRGTALLITATRP